MVKAKKHNNSVTILHEIDELENLFLQCRSVFPTLTEGLQGHREFTTAPYYLRRGYKAHIKLREPITLEFMERNKRLGKWINENAIIRLYGIMHYYGFTKTMTQKDKIIPGAREVDLMRRMRNAFTKTQLNYRPSDSENVELRKQVIEHFNLDEKEFPEGEIPTPINKVIEKIFKGCRSYVSVKTKNI
jgi:hypothetical protein